MKQKNKMTSYRKLLLTSILGVSLLLFIIILMSIIYLVEAHEKENLEKNTHAWANSLAQASVGYLIDSSKESKRKANVKLKELVTPEFINYIHLYKKSDNNEVTFFTGFNKSIYYPTIPDKIDHIEELSTITYQKSHADLVVEIVNGKKIVGYLYIQATTEYLDGFIRELAFYGLCLLLGSLLILMLFANRIKSRINQPISMLVESVQEIAHHKNYAERIDNLPIIELDILAKNINVLLTRTEKHINKKDENHQQTLLQNNQLAEKVQARTDALKESNQELLSTLEKLHQFQGQLVETEKMASLGDMVAGIAHEVNTPIGLGVTASTLLNDRLLEIKQSFEDKSLKSSQLKKFLTQGEENIGIIYRNLERAAKLISSFKKVAVDQSSVDTRTFNVNELLEEVYVTLKSKLDKKHVNLVIDCPDDLVIESKPGPINQILLNLILNSIIHGFENKPDGEINVSIMYMSEQLHVSYKDNGIGIDEGIKSKVFEPFTTTKRGSGGSGLGLHLVYNIVTQALNGHIDFESTADLGTTFNITFPAFLVSEQ